MLTNYVGADDVNGNSKGVTCSQICDTAKACSYYNDQGADHQIRDGDVFFYDKHDNHYHVNGTGHVIGQGVEAQRYGKWKHVSA